MILFGIMEVLIVEDEVVISLATARMVESLGHTVMARVTSAEIALAALEKGLPDLIFMDIHLDGTMDGIQAAEEIRLRWGIPVAFASAFADEETRKRAASAGPVAFIPKPLRLASLRTFFESYKPAV